MLNPANFMECIIGLNVEEEDYDWGKQSRTNSIQSPLNMSTTHATQTFDVKGNPKDRDND